MTTGSAEALAAMRAAPGLADDDALASVIVDELRELFGTNAIVTEDARVMLRAIDAYRREKVGL